MIGIILVALAVAIVAAVLSYLFERSIGSGKRSAWRHAGYGALTGLVTVFAVLILYAAGLGH